MVFFIKNGYFLGKNKWKVRLRVTKLVDIIFTMYIILYNNIYFIYFIFILK